MSSSVVAGKDPSPRSLDLDRVPQGGSPLLSITKVAASRGLAIHPATAIRWARRGASGVRLAAVKVAGQWRCTEEAFDLFIHGLRRAQNGVIDSPDSAFPRVEEAVDRAHRQSMAELQKYGLGGGA